MSRVTLRAPALEDADEFVALCRASRHYHRPWMYPPDTPDKWRSYVERTAGERFAPYLACRTDDGAIVGWFTIGEIVRGALQGGFLGYSGFAPSAGQGYMTEGMALLLHEAFTRVGLHRLEANIQPANAASIGLAKRCGFELEGFSPRYLKIGGRWRDHERYAIRRETWRARRPAERRAAP